MRWRGLSVASAVSILAIALVPAAASGDGGGGPPAVDCDPFALSSGAFAAARVPEGVTAPEPNLDQAYEQALEGVRAPATRRARASSTVRVPVHIHVVQPAAGPSIVTETQIANQMTVLNNSFNGTSGGDNSRIVFELIDTDVTANPAWVDLEPDTAAEVEMKTALHEGGTRSLNLYLLSLGTFLGWATFPTSTPSVMDGVVVERDSVPGGSGAPNNLGDTAPHEVGHWLGLFHTFEGGCGPPGDFVDDTEPEAVEHFGCAVSDSCAGGANDPVDNFMSYADDSCMNKFTPGQGNRMHDHIAAFRNGAPAVAAVLNVSTPSAQPVAVNVQATDPDGDALSYAVTDPPDHGTVGGSAGAFTYTPNSGFSGADSFVVQAADVFGRTGTARVGVSVTGIDLKAKAKAKQRLSKLAIEGSCGAQGCTIAVTGKIAATGPAGKRAAKSKSFKLKPASGRAEAGKAAKLRLKLSKSKQRKLLALLGDGWKAKADVKITATDAAGATGSETATIAVKR